MSLKSFWQHFLYRLGFYNYHLTPRGAQLFKYMMNVVDGKWQEPIPEFEQWLNEEGGDKQEAAQKIVDILSKCERN